jgi:cytochrome c oxidase subunit II
VGRLSIFPERASTVAGEVDALYAFLTAVSILMTVLIFFCVFLFAVKYRRRTPNDRPRPIYGSIPLEITWSAVPFGVMLIMFGWGAKLFFESSTPPPNTLDIYVTGKQWMWKVQYPDGHAEINQLHVPTGRPVRLIMASEDVIHSFYIPAFRIKRDVVPGTYQTMWFEATKPGDYHLFCAEYCGTDHSRMRGVVTVMQPADYEAWLSGGRRGGTLTERGRTLFEQFGCAGCHAEAQRGRCPPLQNVYGRPQPLEGGGSVIADENYIRESIFDPNAKIVAGYQPNIMPSFQGQIDEQGLLELMAYIRSLSAPAAPKGVSK